MSQPDGINNTPEEIADRPRRLVASRVPRVGVSVLPLVAPAVVPGVEEAERRRIEELEESEEELHVSTKAGFISNKHSINKGRDVQAQKDVCSLTPPLKMYRGPWDLVVIK